MYVLQLAILFSYIGVSYGQPYSYNLYSNRNYNQGYPSYNSYGYSGDRALYDPPRQPGAGAGDIRLPVQQRFQWQEANGYCGEQSLQIAAMFFGTWASEWSIRDMNIQFVQKKTGRTYRQDEKAAQWTVGVDEKDAIMDALSVEYALFDADTPAPQFQTFMTWMKNWIQVSESPVIMGMYVKDQQDKDYDHIALAHGILSNTKDDPVYNPNDILLFSALQETTGREGTEAGYYFKDLKNTRQGTNVGNNVFQLPDRFDYGIAVFGFRLMENAYHTRVEVRNPFPFELPELAGCQRGNFCFKPGVFAANIISMDLTKGEKYSLLRYDTPSNVPKKEGQEFCNSNYDARWDFIATGQENKIPDQFNQVTVVTYRTADNCPDFDTQKYNGKHSGIKTNFPLGARTGRGSRFNNASGLTNDQLFNYYFGDLNMDEYKINNGPGALVRQSNVGSRGGRNTYMRDNQEADNNTYTGRRARRRRGRNY